MIPKQIHYCWYGRGQMTTLHRRCLESWKKNLPSYQVQRWDESNTKFDNAFLKEALRMEQWAFISDYIRMRALHDHGGIYLDCDIEVVRDFEPLLDLECFLGEEAEGRPNTAVLAARARHDFPRLCMELIEDQYRARRGYLIAPEIAMLALKTAGGSASVTILPSDCFYPYNPSDPKRKDMGLMYADVTQQTFAIHHWAKGWKMSRKEKTRKSLNKLAGRLGLR